MGQRQPDERGVDHDEVAERAGRSTDPVGPGNRYARPLVIVPAALAVLVIIWLIVGSGLLF